MQPRRDLLAASHLSPPLPSKLEMHPTRDDYQVKSQSRLHENSKRLYFRKFRKMRDVKRKLKKKNIECPIWLEFVVVSDDTPDDCSFSPVSFEGPINVHVCILMLIVQNYCSASVGFLHP